jgi:hypothetical protein
MALYSKIRKLVFRAEILFKRILTDGSKLPVLLFDTSIDSDNLGDFIINDYCSQILNEIKIQPIGRVATHRSQTREEIELLGSHSLKIVTGTNILSATLTSQWIRPEKLSLQTNVLLMGAGWTDYNNNVRHITSLYYKKVLTRSFKHCVRDRFTKETLNSIGINNVIYTGCPAMWKLTPQLCKQIPEKKGKYVVCTITDYSRVPEIDFSMIDILLSNYEEVFFWPQGKYDLEYISTYRNIGKLHILDATLKAYDDLLSSQESLDYVGTRLHAGIRALNHKVRSIVIAIDNRAIEIANDTGLRIIHRESLVSELPVLINTRFRTTIDLPFESIREWKDQFNDR